MKLANKTILITGGATGIGLEFARALNRNGNTIVICGRRHAKLDEATAAVTGIVGIQCDVTDADQVGAMLATIEQDHGAGSPVQVFEVLPPITETEMVAEMIANNQGGPKAMGVVQMVTESIAGIEAGRTEIPVGMSKQLRVMGRLAPGFIEGKLAQM